MSDIIRSNLPHGSQTAVPKSAKGATAKTIRILVVLPNSTEDTYPEYNYKDEHDAIQKRNAKKLSKTQENGQNGVENFFNDDDSSDVKRIAQEMEEKYGKGYGPSSAKKKKRGHKDDYADIGMGYDENDSFIDNTDGYDEIIPQNVTTLHGGFYINSGALEFKTDNEDSSSDEDSSSSDSSRGSTVKRSGKRIISSSESENDDKDDSDRQPNKKLKTENGVNGLQKALKKKLFNHNKIQVKKRRPLDPHKKTVKDLLKEKRVDLNLSNKTLLENEASTIEENASPMAVSSINDAIESVIKSQVVGSSSLINSSENSTIPAKSSQAFELPENLQPNIVDIINRLTNMVKEKRLAGPSVFTEEINLLLTSMERKCKCLGKPSKIKVYNFLSNVFSCDYQLLVDNNKMLMKKDEERKLKTLIQKLRKEIAQLMPSHIENYAKECEIINQKRSLSQDKEENSKNCRMPKRRFQWNDLTRKLLKDILVTKKRILGFDSKEQESLELEIAKFLKSEVLNLWPDKWVTIASLTKAGDNILNNSKTTTAKKESTNNTPHTSLNLPNLSITPVPPSLNTSESAAKTESKTANENNNSSSFVKIDYNKPDLGKETNTKVIKNRDAVQIIDLDVESIINKVKTIKPPRENGIAKETLPKPQLELDKSGGTQPQKHEPSKIRDPSSKHHHKHSKSDHKSKEHSKTGEDHLPRKEHSSNNVDTKKVKTSDNSNKSTSNVRVIEVPPKVQVAKTADPQKYPNMKDITWHSSKSADKNSHPPITKSLTPQVDIKTVNPQLNDVMEQLKLLQKMSSPVKTIDLTSPSKSSHVAPTSVLKNVDFSASQGFQDEFQKQLLNSLANASSSSSKNNYKCS